MIVGLVQKKIEISEITGPTNLISYRIYNIVGLKCMARNVKGPLPLATSFKSNRASSPTNFMTYSVFFHPVLYAFNDNKAVYTAALVADGWAGAEKVKKQLCD